jgi:hypothetical protein
VQERNQLTTTQFVVARGGCALLPRAIGERGVRDYTLSHRLVGGGRQASIAKSKRSQSVGPWAVCHILLASLPPSSHASNNEPYSTKHPRIAERDRLRDFNLVSDARLELDEPALERRAVVGGNAHIGSRARLDLIVVAKRVAADSRDT